MNQLEPITIETIRRLKGPQKGEALRRYYAWIKEQREEYRTQYGLPKISGERKGFSGRYGLARRKAVKKSYNYIKVNKNV